MTEERLIKIVVLKKMAIRNGEGIVGYMTCKVYVSPKHNIEFNICAN